MVVCCVLQLATDLAKPNDTERPQDVLAPRDTKTSGMGDPKSAGYSPLKDAGPLDQAVGSFVLKCLLTSSTCL
jgi:hypothetical protein